MNRRSLLALVVWVCAAFSLASSTGDDAAKLEVPKDVRAETGSSRAWALALCALLTEREGWEHDLLAGRPGSEGTVRGSRSDLERAGVARRGEVHELLDRYSSEGQRASLEQLFVKVVNAKLTEQQVEELFDPKRMRTPIEDRVYMRMKALARHGPRLLRENDPLLACDALNHVRACRVAHAAGYLTEEQTWRRLDTVARKLQSAYDSWDDLWSVYLVGEEIFRPEHVSRLREIQRKLTEADTCPWRALPWDEKLASLAAPEPKPAAGDGATPPKK